MIFNKKGDVPTILIFVAALALSLTALYIFITFSNNLQPQPKEINELIFEIDFNQKYIQEKAKIMAKEKIISNVRFQDLEKTDNFQLSGAGNFFGKLRNNDLKFTKQENSNYKLEISDLFVQSQKGENRIRRNFNICMLFDSKGNFISNC